MKHIERVHLKIEKTIISDCREAENALREQIRKKIQELRLIQRERAEAQGIAEMMNAAPTVDIPNSFGDRFVAIEPHEWENRFNLHCRFAQKKIAVTGLKVERNG